MTQDDYVQNLLNDLELLRRSLSWLQRSFKICTAFSPMAVLLPEEFDAVESFTSRYARTTDILIQKIFRSIDKVELEEGGTMIDVVNRAHKRRLFDSVDEIRELKDLRNKIAHEYSKEDVEKLFAEVLDLTPRLFSISRSVALYCARYGADPESFQHLQQGRRTA